MEYTFRQATEQDQQQIWEILEQAIRRRKEDGSRQWQDGYPNTGSVREDIACGHGYVLLAGADIAGYSAVIINDEPAYAAIDGQWITDSDFVVCHRVAVSDRFLGQGLAQKIFGFIEAFAAAKGINSVKVDTNYDNPGMLRILEKRGYQYCGEVVFRGGSRKAFEKVLD